MTKEADYRDCIELAGEIASAVEYYEGDDLLGQIIPPLQPVIGRIQEAEMLLLRCYAAGHKEGWQDGETSEEVFEAVNNFMSDRYGTHWFAKLSSMSSS